VKLMEFWQGLENARPARPAGASVIDRLAKKSVSVFSLVGDVVVVRVENASRFDNDSYPSCPLLSRL
jgi:hypothetical protein